MELNIEALQKEIRQLQSTKDNLNNRVKQLSEEQERYLDQIPLFKKQADEYNKTSEAYSDKLAAIRIELGGMTEKLQDAKNELYRAKYDLVPVLENYKTALSDIENGREELKNSYIKSKARETAISERERLVEAREDKLHDKINDHVKDEIGLIKSKKEFHISGEKLSKEIEAHEIIVKDHQMRVDVFNENRKAHIAQEDLYKNKINDVDIIMKNNSKLKIDLDLKNGQLDQEIAKYKTLQDSLDKNISDLENHKKKVQIMELRVKKLAHDAGLDKELKELEESLR